jgi:peptide/nickel transport system permease protein
VLRYLVSRLFQGATIVLLVASATFLLLQSIPGDPVDALGSRTRLSPEVAHQQRVKFGLDRSIGEQYLRYIGNVVRGDLGHSYSERRPVWDAIWHRIPATMLLAIAALLIDFALGISIGAIQGARARTHTDNVLSIITLTLYSVPVFWFGMVLNYLFAQKHNWLPVSGLKTEWLYPGATFVTAFGDHAQHLLLPAITLGLVGAASTARFQRGAMQEVINQDFVRFARAKGLHEHTVKFRHALRNALLPVITHLGLSLGFLLSGAVLVEKVFEWPGIGTLAVNAFTGRDYPLMTGIAIVVAAMVVFGNLVADLLYRVSDPRMRSER